MIKLFGGRVRIGKDISQLAGRSDENPYAIMSARYGVDYTSKNKLKAYRNIVYGCVSLIGEACGEYEPMLQRKNGDQWQTIDHEFISLTKNPSGRDLKATSFSSFELWEATASFMLLQGDCFWYLARGKTTGRPREIVMLRADRVGTDVDPKTGEVNGYFIRQFGGDPIPLEIEEVLRFPLFNPESGYKGRGAVESGSDYISTDESTAAFTKNYFANNAGVSGVLNIKGEVTKGAFRKFVRAWRDKYQGVGNAGKTAILRDSDAVFTQVGSNLGDLAMPDLRRMTLDDVLMMFKVPLPLLGKADQTGLGRANVEALEYIFAKYNIDKKMQRFDSILMFALQRYYGLDPASFRVTHKSVIPDDKEFELSERTQGVDKWIKRNEARDEEGLDPVDGGDQLFVPLNEVPINEASMAATPPATANQSIKVKITRKVKKAKKPSRADTERFRLQQMRTQARYEKRYRAKAKPIFESQRKEALTTLEQHATSLTKTFQFFNGGDYEQKMADSFTPVLTDLAQVQGGLAMVFAGDQGSEFLMGAPFKALLRRGTEKMAQGLNDRTLDRLTTTIAEGMKEGEGIGALKGRVNSIFDDLQGYESERIARTETLKASNAATAGAYKQTGYVNGKEWVVNPDACEECVSFDGMTVPLDDDFLAMGDSYNYTDENGDEQTKVNTYDTVETPPLHPNCRCTIIPVS